jgi:hypothetical protein
MHVLRPSPFILLLNKHYTNYQGKTSLDTVTIIVMQDYTLRKIKNIFQKRILLIVLMKQHLIVKM